MSINEQTRLNQIKNVSTFFIVLMAFWILFDLLNIAGFTESLSQMLMTPRKILNGLYALTWIIVLFAGRKLGLNALGYIGAMIMLCTSVWELALTVCPLAQFLYDHGFDFQQINVITTVSSAVTVLFDILGMFLLLLGARFSWLLALVTPGYFIISFGLFTGAGLLFAFLEWPIWALYSICAFLCMLYIIVVLLPVFFVWRKGAITIAKAI